ncbi:PhzF family phenazine biosynthesis protein [Lentzea sp. CA-135723]|uniref:PhzF family phenazine biosynthesis protein n=1 Tax=Lentzea sp. CA-135723 TaxID=3239950 RepID=UPI003D8CB14E
MLRFSQVDVFTDELTKGNALAVVHDAEGLSTEEMAAFANWTNLAETTFLLPPRDPAADYRVRIFTTSRELAFAAPPLLRTGPVENLPALAAGLAIPPDEIVEARWADNGPGWVAVLLRSADAVLALRPDYTRFGEFTGIGVVGPHEDGGDAAFEVRAFVDEDGRFGEDPVTGSLNASIAQWLIPAEIARRQYVAAQGTVLGRRGRVHLSQADGQIWVGGDTVVGITGKVALQPVR